MKIEYQLERDQGSFSIGVQPEEFDAEPGLEKIFFQGINEPVSPEASALAGWILLAPFLSRRLIFPESVSQPLIGRMVESWDAPIELSPIDGKPKAFPSRLGSLMLYDPGLHQGQGASVFNKPLYQLALSTLNASGTVYDSGKITVKTNASLLAHNQLTSRFPVLIATAVLYADFLGIADIVVLPDQIGSHVPCKRKNRSEDYQEWQELLKHAGFNLHILK